jgi:hypothetical protein
MTDGDNHNHSTGTSGTGMVAFDGIDTNKQGSGNGSGSGSGNESDKNMHGWGCGGGGMYAYLISLPLLMRMGVSVVAALVLVGITEAVHSNGGGGGGGGGGVTPVPVPVPVPPSAPGSPTPAPTPTYGTCTGKSASLSQSQCDAWQDLWRGTGGDTTWLYCNTNSFLLDPCSCSYTSPGGHGSGVTCSSTAITFLSLSSLGMTGTLPSSLSALTGLTYFHVACNALTGQLPNLDYSSIVKGGDGHCYVGGPNSGFPCGSGQGAHTSGNTNLICPKDANGFTFSATSAGCYGTCTSN